MSGFVINPFVFGAGAAPAFAPDDISGLRLWLDADDDTTITDAGGAVSAWNDKSGNGFHVTQAVGALQPSTGINTLNGKNVLTFAAGDRLTNTSGVITGSTNRTVFVVTSHAGGDTVGAPFHLGKLDGLAANRGAFACTREMAIRVQGGNQIYGSALSTVGASLAVYGLDGTTVADMFARLDGAPLTASSVASPTETMNTESGLHIANGINGEYDYAGRIAEVIAYNSALSTSDVDDVEAYLADKWGITI